LVHVLTECLLFAVFFVMLHCLQGEVQVPEPPADRITQLTEMGFSDTLARNALLLQRSNVEAALEWLLEHGDDPAGAEPIPEDRLRQVCTCQLTVQAAQDLLAAASASVGLSYRSETARQTMQLP
jgi:hypothetical protein